MLDERRYPVTDDAIVEPGRTAGVGTASTIRVDQVLTADLAGARAGGGVEPVLRVAAFGTAGGAAWRDHLRRWRDDGRSARPAAAGDERLPTLIVADAASAEAAFAWGDGRPGRSVVALAGARAAPPRPSGAAVLRSAGGEAPDFAFGLLAPIAG